MSLRGEIEKVAWNTITRESHKGAVSRLRIQVSDRLEAITRAEIDRLLKGVLTEYAEIYEAKAKQMALDREVPYTIFHKIIGRLIRENK